MKRCARIIGLLVWPLYLKDLYLISLGNDRLGILWSLDVVFFLLIPSATLFLLTKSGRLEASVIGLNVFPKLIDFLVGVGLCAILLPIFSFFLIPTLESVFRGRLFVGYDFPDRQPLRFILIIYAALSAGILEEIVYRGVVISELQRASLPPALAVAISCLIFGGIHWGEGLGKVVAMALFGMPFAIWYVRRRSLWAPIISHTLYNLLIYSGAV